MAAADAVGHADAPLAMRVALEARDLEGFVQALSPDVVLRSPITTGFVFAGREQLRTLYQAVFDGIEDFRVTEEVAGPDGIRVLFLDGHVGGQKFEEVQRLRLDEEGRVRELTLFFRPLPALPALANVLAGTWIAQRSTIRAVFLKLLVGPLVLMTRIGDRIVVRMVSAISGMTTPTAD